MPVAVSVARLCEHPALVPFFANRFEHEWPDWYGPGGQGNAVQDLREFADPSGRLPVGVVALSTSGEPVGVAALRANSIPRFSHLTPWATAGYVLPELRGQGIGAMLLSALVTEARRLDFKSVYCATSAAGSLLLREGWQLLENTRHDDKPIAVFSRSV